MAKMKLKQLRDADVRYISLVDRAATRIPFRVLKRDKENTMGIDLTRVFKSEGNDKPHVTALVVFAQKREAVATAIREAIEQHGFTTKVVQKSDEGETLVYAQGDQSGDPQVVRLSDQLLASVAGLTTPTGWVGEMIKEHGFYPDLKMATAALYDHVHSVAKSETPQAEATAVLDSYAQYLNQMLVLPSAVYALNDVVQKCACQETPVAKGEKKKPAEGSAEEEADESSEEEATEDKKAMKNETEEERLKRIAAHPPAEMAPVDEEDDQKPPPDAFKADLQTLLKGIETLTAKIDAVAIEQADQKKVLDGVVQKADTLNTTLKSTVTASPVAEDRPAGSTRMRVQKDDDPRTGNFDTAFLRRRR